ncbi:TPA: hypothetical protein RTH11_000443 [Campylobacter jejuni]|nr:hypothetical protein [Campylobacter jejuni]
MALIEVCGKLIDTKIKFSGKPALDFAEIALEKEKAKQKEEQKKLLSIQYSEEYLSIKASKITQEGEVVEDSENTKENKIFKEFELYHSKFDFKLDIYV